VDESKQDACDVTMRSFDASESS